MIPGVAPSRIFVGTSGWAYSSWKPGFYPPKVPAKGFLEYYASQLTAVEVNYTFRALPSPAMLEGWLSSTPDKFRFAFKSPQRITHFNRLLHCEAELDRFLNSLKPAQTAGRLGPILFQLPPNFKADIERLRAFLAMPQFKSTMGLRPAFEFRHASWFAEDIYDVLRGAGAALCIADGDELETPDVQCAADFTCCRLRRSGGYSPTEIEAFADRFTARSRNRDVFVFFRHEEEPTGAANAAALLSACARRTDSA